MDTSTTKVPPAPTPIIDSSKYIRTYAKDFAAMSGKNLEVVKTIDSVKQYKRQESEFGPLVQSEPETKERPDDLSILERQAETTDKKTDQENLEAFGVTKQEETFALPSIEAGDLVQGIVAPPGPTELEQAIRDSSATEPTPFQVEREGILARLKAKVPNVSQSNMMPKESVGPSRIQTPSFFAPVTPNIESDVQPVSTPEPQPLPQPSSLSTIERTPEPKPLHEKHIQVPKEKLSPIHTYKSDFSDHIDQQGASTFAVLAAENDAPRIKRKVRRSSNKLLPVAAGFVLIVAGIGAAYGAYVVLGEKAPVPVLSTVVSSIVPDGRVELSTKSGPLIEALAAQANQVITSGSVIQTYITASTTNSGNSNSLFTAMNLQAPDILIRNTDPASTIGVVHAGTETRAFFILNVSSYERTFAGMLQWESTMPTDLVSLYPSYPAEAVTSSTTPVAVGTEGFVDEVVASHNARALKDASGKTVLLYGYADSRTLIIARDEQAFELLLSRLQARGT